MGKKSNKKSGQVSWVAEIKRNEVIYGYLGQPLPLVYPHLKNVIWKANNDRCFHPDPCRPGLKQRLGNCEFSGHPFGEEIRNFDLPVSYLEAHYGYIMSPLSAERCVPKWVDEKVHFVQLIKQLKRVKHIFMDLENHTWRSYRGITSLLQVSDGKDVYLVDTLKLSQEMPLFASVLEDPNILKVFHASQNDIKWLEKDFSLYVVGLLDTQIMHRVLYSTNNISYKDIVQDCFPDAGLDKAVRNTDFRQRPLHPEQLKYAALDVFYLPAVFFKLLSEMDALKLKLVVTECRKVSLLRYTFPDLLPDKPTDSPVMKSLKVARDIAAKKEDVNPEFLCSVSAPEKLILKKEVPLGITSTPNIYARFLTYKDAIIAALNGHDPKPVFETAYRDLGMPFPYRPMLFCFNCEATTHVKRDCPEPRSLGKEKKRLHYLANPEKKKKETRRRNAKVKQNPIAKLKRNVRINRRKLKKRLAALVV